MSAVTGLLKGIGQGLADAGRMGLQDHYEQLRMKKTHEYNLETLEVKNEYATQSQNRQHEHDRQTQESDQAFKSKQSVDARDHDTQMQDSRLDHAAREGALEREAKAKIQAAKGGSGGKQTTEYYKAMIKSKSDQLAWLQESNEQGEPNGTPEQIQNARAELSRFEAEYRSIVGLPASQTSSQPEMSADDVLTRFMQVKKLEDTPENRQAASEALSKHPTYGHMFEESKPSQGLLKRGPQTEQEARTAEFSKRQREYATKVRKTKDANQALLPVAKFNINKQLKRLANGETLSSEELAKLHQHIGVLENNNDRGENQQLIDQISQYLNI